MPDNRLAILALLLAAIPVSLILLRRLRETRALRLLAREKRLRFSVDDTIDLPRRFHHLELFREGHQRRACHVMQGTAGPGTLFIFRYTYDLGFGGNRTSRSWWVAVLETAACHAPWRAEPAGQDDGPNRPPPRSSPASGDSAGSKAGVASPPRNASPGEPRRFRIEADHQVTRDRLQAANVLERLADAPPSIHVEVQGHLVAAFTPAPADVGHLLRFTLELAGHDALRDDHSVIS